MKLIKKLSIGLVLALILIALYFLSFLFLNRDIKDVELRGKIIELNTEKIIENAVIKISSDRYQSDSGKSNYDEYLGHDELIKISNNDGEFNCKIPQSSFVWLDISKNGYKSKTVKGRYSEKYMDFGFIKLELDDN
jgi:hypothetical protein